MKKISKKQKSPKDDLVNATLSVEMERSVLQNLGDATLETASSILSSFERLNRNLQSVMLIYWRLGTKDLAVASLTEVLANYETIYAMIDALKVKPMMNSAWPNFGRASLFSYLLNGEFDTRLLKRCKFKASTEIMDQQAFEIADMHLALTIANGRMVRGYEEFLHTYFRNRRKSFVADTYAAYSQLVSAVSRGDREQLQVLISKCEQYYLRRADDEDFKYFGLGEGTARFNSQHLDFRLATIIKWAYRDYPKERRALTTIHQWRFD